MASATVGLLRVILTADTAEFDAAMNRASRSASSWSKSLGTIGRQASQIGQTMTATLTLPLVAAGAMAIKTGAQFEAAMNSIQGVLRPTGSEMERVRATALKMGADTAFSATDAATAILELGKAGFSTAEAIQAVPQVLELAAASGLSMGEAAELAARSLNSFGLKTSDLSHVNDVLAKAVNSSTLEIGDMQTAFKYIGPIAQGFNISIEEVSAALAVMRDNGIAAETSGRALREGMSRLANPVKAVHEVVGELGISLAQLNPETNSMADIIGLLESKGLTAAQALRMFGDAAGPGMFALVQKGAAGLVDLTNEFKNSEGAAKAMADAMMTGLPGALERLRGSVETAWIAISKAIEPTVIRLSDVLGNLADLIGTKLAPAFMALPEPVQTTSLALLGLVAAAGPVLYVSGQLITATGTVIGLFKEGAIGARALTAAFGFVTAPVTAIVTAIGSLAIAWASFKNDWTRAFDVLIPPLGGFRNAIDGVKAALAPYQSIIDDVAAVARGVFVQAWTSASNALAQFRDSYLVPLQEKFNSFKTTVGQIADALRGILVTAFNQAKQAVIDFIPGLQTLLNAESSLRDWAAKGRQHLADLADGYRATAADAAAAGGSLASTSLAGANAYGQFSGAVAQAGAAAAGARPNISGLGDDTERSGKKAKDATADYREFMNWIGERQMEAAAIGIKAQEDFAASVTRGIAALTPFRAAVVSTGESIRALGGSINDLVSTSLRDFAVASTAARQEALDWANANGAVLAPSVRQVTAASLLGGEAATGFMGRVRNAFSEAGLSAQSMANTFAQAFTGGGGILGGFKAVATQGLGALMSMIPAVGPWLQAFSGPIIEGLSRLARRAGDILRGIFGGPSREELDQREQVAGFEDELHGALTAQQELESQGEDWRRTVIAIRDAYIAAGRSEEEALRDAERLWQSSREGGEDALAVIEEIRRKMLALTSGEHTIAVGVEYRTSAPPGTSRPDLDDPNLNRYQDPGFASGTMGRFGSWFKNFGPGLPTMLHGMEAVLRPQDVAPFALDALSGLSTAAGSSITNNRSSIAVLPVIMGSGKSPRELAQDAVRHLAESGLPNDESGIASAFESVIDNWMRSYALG